MKVIPKINGLAELVKNTYEQWARENLNEAAVRETFKDMLQGAKTQVFGQLLGMEKNTFRGWEMKTTYGAKSDLQNLLEQEANATVRKWLAHHPFELTEEMKLTLVKYVKSEYKAAVKEAIHKQIRQRAFDETEQVIAQALEGLEISVPKNQPKERW